MVTATEDSVIVRKTLELCQTILDQDEFQSVRKNIDAFMGDATAQSQYQEVVEKGNLLQQKQQSGAPMTGEEISAFEQQRDQLLNNPVAKGFLEAQEAMNKVQSSVNDYLTKTFELGRLPSAEDFDQGSCGSGCGCH
jgi:cell fate (sporulation/competence/biofilm development) regulator YlbF (YheA/YmcA/DUF963 family)